MPVVPPRHFRAPAPVRCSKIGYTVKDIPELACISASTVKTHNRNLYRKLEVDSFDELKVYIELFASCGHSSELLNK